MSGLMVVLALQQSMTRRPQYSRPMEYTPSEDTELKQERKEKKTISHYKTMAEQLPDNGNLYFDNPLERDLARRALQDSGFHVRDINSGLESDKYELKYFK